MADGSISPSAGPEQRVALRHRCSFAALTRLIDSATGKKHFAWVHDISASGVAFDLRLPPAPGAELLCQLKGNRPEECFEVRATVIHARLVDGLHRVGCHFLEPFPPDRLEAVLRRLRDEMRVA